LSLSRLKASISSCADVVAGYERRDLAFNSSPFPTPLSDTTAYALIGISLSLSQALML